MTAASIISIPNEIIETKLLSYLSTTDVISFSEVGNYRFKEVANNVIQQRTTRILIAGGRNEDSLSSAYILNIVFDISRDISEISYSDFADMPKSNWMAFYQKCGDKIIIGGGRGSEPWDNLSQVVEYSEEKWKNFPSLNVIRDKCPASCYVQNTLIISGGYEPSRGRLDSLEFIDISNEKNGCKEWTICKSLLPVKVLAHTLSEMNGKIYLIGGNVTTFCSSNKIWEGTIDNDKEFKFQEVCSMKERRVGHFSIVVENQIHIFGGEMDSSTSSVEVFDGKELRTGPHFPFYLDRSNSNAILNKSALIIILTNDHGIVIYDPIERTIKVQNNFKLKGWREYYSAILLQ